MNNTVSQTLTLEELVELKRLEAVVTSSFEGISRHISVCGEALSKIREAKLYRATHKTFEAYCMDRWGKSARTAYKAIGAWETKKELLENAPQGRTDDRAVVIGFAEGASAKSLLEVAKIREDKRVDTILEAHRKADGKPVASKAIVDATKALAHRPSEPAQRPNGFESCYGSPAPAVCAPEIADSAPVTGPAGTAPREPARPPTSEPLGATVSGMTLDQFRAKVAMLRVTGTALIVFVDASGPTMISRMNFNPQTDRLEIE